MFINREFPTASNKFRFGDMLQAPGYKRLDENGVEEIYSGHLGYLEFIALVKKIWEEGNPNIPIFPLGANKENLYTYFDNQSSNKLDQMTQSPKVNGLELYPAIIGYSLELRKTHSVEPKPRMRQNVVSNAVTIYGQKFQNVISFTVMSKVGTFQGSDITTTRDDLDAAVLCDQIIEAFEDFMLEYTPIFKAAGASDLVYSRRLSDSDVSRDAKNLHKRVVTYLLTTEKTFAIKNELINQISIDVRRWIESEKSLLPLATPNFIDTPINIVDLNLGNQ